MKNYQIYLFLILLGFNLAISEKVLMPYCGPKTKNIRFCINDQECKYSDEFCSKGVCLVA